MNDIRLAQEENISGADRAARLRAEMVDALVAEETVVSASVEAAMRTVPRELFLPGVDLEEAFQLDNGVVTKRDADGTAVSSVSAPRLQAHMLEQAEIAEGMRTLEVGSGGYHAALLAELVGPWGQVTTVDIDSEVTDRAGQLLEPTGYAQVRVVCADAEFGVSEHAPYDRILITVGCWDVAPALVEQLAAGGRLLVPLRIRGLSRTIAFDLVDGHLASRSARLFGFVPLRGAGAHEDTSLVLRDGEVALRFDEEIPADPSRFNGLFDRPRVEVWTGVTIGRYEPWADTQMWLATMFPGFCRVVLDRSLDTGLISPPGKHSFAVGAVSGGTLAYMTVRGADSPDDIELGVQAYGPDAAAFAKEMAEQLRVWGRDHRGGPGPQFRLYPAGTPDDALPAGPVVDKKHSRIVISWPASARAEAGQVARQDPITQGR
ncbi:methyltransferase, FxLD system [Pseudofrankia sp. BMG5.37]|uniref:methyltransferase, FxLD system n=1 Tax=Pseudofrankia sp. BMG5.37 TaxID=3050035 RepID=UPI002895D0B6|nr:methyltransferase, FxLD system [Pseudofrankia sp. BMG5.37]MDT3444480.1 methyltransferase, FxLD system [Pseudofrankia sp. BMG5.37]